MAEPGLGVDDIQVEVDDLRDLQQWQVATIEAPARGQQANLQAVPTFADGTRGEWVGRACEWRRQCLAVQFEDYRGEPDSVLQTQVGGLQQAQWRRQATDARAPLVEDEERHASGAALQAGQAYEEGDRHQQAQRRRLTPGAGVIAQGPDIVEQQQAEQSEQRCRAMGSTNAYPVGNADDEAPQPRGFVIPYPGEAGCLHARWGHQFSP